MVFVKISDTGIGMSEEVKNQMLDPFLTIRSPERTGLGMGIVKRHDGMMEVESEEGKGTTLTMSCRLRMKLSSKNYHRDLPRIK